MRPVQAGGACHRLGRGGRRARMSRNARVACFRPSGRAGERRARSPTPWEAPVRYTVITPCRAVLAALVVSLVFAMAAHNGPIRPVGRGSMARGRGLVVPLYSCTWMSGEEI